MTQLEDDEFDSEISGTMLMLQLLKHTSHALRFMSENLSKDIDFFPRAVNNNDMTIVCDLFDLCDKKIRLDLNQ